MKRVSGLNQGIDTYWRISSYSCEFSALSRVKNIDSIWMSSSLTSLTFSLMVSFSTNQLNYWSIQRICLAETAQGLMNYSCIVPAPDSVCSLRRIDKRESSLSVCVASSGSSWLLVVSYLLYRSLIDCYCWNLGYSSGDGCVKRGYSSSTMLRLSDLC